MYICIYVRSAKCVCFVMLADLKTHFFQNQVS